MPKLTVNIGSLKFSNPTELAAGILNNGALLKRAAIEGGAGAVVTKSLTGKRREGYPNPTIVGVRVGLINAIGMANPGYVEFLRHELPLAKEGKVCVIVSVAGSNVGEFLKISSAAEDAGADAVELNLSCPHVKKRGLEIGSDPGLVHEIVKEVKGALKIPVYAKLGLTDRLTDAALKAEDAGTDAIVAINTIKAMAIDVHARKPVLSNIYGGLSGPAIHPIAVRCIYELYEILSVPLIGSGGVEDWQTAVELLLAGASVVQVGSAVATKNLEIFKEIVGGIERYLDIYGFRGVKEIIGYAHG